METPENKDVEQKEKEKEKEPEFAAFVGIDWAEREHAWSMEFPGQKERRWGKVENTPEAIATWAVELAACVGVGGVIAVALEQARGALLYALSAYGHFVLYPIHPTTSARYRAAMRPSGAKDDPADADLLLDLLVRHRDQLRPWRPDSPAIRKLQTLVEKRRQLVDERTAQTNRIRDSLKLYFPQVLGWFERMDLPIVAAFLERWPTLEQVQGAGQEELRKFFNRHHCRSPKAIAKRLAALGQACPLTRDAEVVEPAQLMVSVSLAVVAVLREGIGRVEAEIGQITAAQSDYAIFASFPGAGPALAPRLLAAFGSRRERFANASEVLSFSGIAPVVSRSGQTEWIHFRWACPKFLRQTFHEFAAHSIPHCDWAAAFYRCQRDRGKDHHAAVRSLAFKWIRILFRCWQTGQPYSEERYLQARNKTSVPRASAAPTPPPPSAPAPDCGRAVDSELKHIGEVLKNLLAGA
jgi:transposase